MQPQGRASKMEAHTQLALRHHIREHSDVRATRFSPHGGPIDPVASP
jgi:hypothetical protein